MKIPEDGYQLPIKLMEQIYNNYFTPKYDWLDKITFEKYDVIRTDKYIDPELRPKREPDTPDFSNDVFEIVDIKGKIYTNLDIGENKFKTYDDFTKVVGEEQATDFAFDMVRGYNQYLSYTPLRNLSGKSFYQGNFDLTILTKKNKNSEIKEIKTKPKKTPPTSLGMF